MPTASDFRTALYKAMHEATKQNMEYLDLSAGELHRRAGDYPGPDHRIPNCCEVMRAAMAADYGDRILEQPLSGQGASLTIRYALPRPA
jgi:5-methylcytosine-specific restriction protein A